MEVEIKPREQTYEEAVAYIESLFAEVLKPENEIVTDTILHKK